MNIEYLNPQILIPYRKNAKRHPAEQVRLIANSIREFGFQQPIVVDKNNVVVIGHGRLLAAKRLKMESVPVVRVDSLTEEQIKVLRLADNKVAESAWNLDYLDKELRSVLDFDVSDFGFDIDLNIEETKETDSLSNNNHRTAFDHNSFENYDRAQLSSNNFYGIPDMQPTQTIGDKFLRFMDWNEIDDYYNYIAHFYYDDCKFMQAWRTPDKYVDRLRKFKAVISPDFSLYTDFPRILQILSCYRRQWIGAYWQSLGIDVIPDVVWGDEESFAYCFEGIPKNSVVAVSAVGVSNDAEWNGKAGNRFRAGYNEMLNRLTPTKILFYGTILDGLDGDIIRVPSFYEERRKMLYERSKNHGNSI